MNQELRPGEKATNRYVEEQRKNENLLKRGANIASSAIGLGISTKILPFLNELVPSSLALQALRKVDKRVGGFIEKTMENGFSGDEVLGFLRNQFSPKKEVKQEPKSIDPLQIFETSYPDIASALARTMQNGQSPDAAAAILKNSSSFSKDIKKLEKETGKNFVDYVLELFGNRGQQQQPQQQMQQQPEMQQQMQSQVQQGSGVDAQLMAALDKILKM